MRIIKNILKKMLSSQDIIIKRQYFDYVNEDSYKSPLDLIYYNAYYSNNSEFVFRVNVAKCVNILGYSFSDNNFHHFTKFLEQYSIDSTIRYDDSILKEFYDTFQPKTLNDLYFDSNLTVNKDSILLENSLSMSLPWLYFSQKSVDPDMISEAGLKISEGNQSFGPVTLKKGEIEFDRLTKTYNSIKKTGYKIDKFDVVSGYFLRKGDDYRFVIQNGNHRVASLSSLGYDKIKVKFREGFPRVIDIADIDNWPMVKLGKISKENAIKTFDLFFEGRKFDFQDELLRRYNLL